LAFSVGAMATEDSTKPLATVGVYAQHSGGKITYHYRVTNNSQQNITAITIGHNDQNDSNPNNDVNELVQLPSGWNPKLGIPTTSSTSPTGWRVSVIAPDDNEHHAIAWETLNDRSPKIYTGQTFSKMSVSLDMPDDNYLAGHAMITFSDGNLANLTVPLERLDTTPPSFTVNLSPNTILLQGNKLVAIHASFMIKDDYDRLPEIRLESISANEALEADDTRDVSIGLDDRYLKLRAKSNTSSGRIYTVTYSATDASGNRTTASSTVTVTTTMAAPVTKSATSLRDQGERKNIEPRSR
jgi:hypothetical protein